MKKYRVLSMLVALVMLALLPIQSASGMYTAFTVLKWRLQSEFMEATIAFYEQGPVGYSRLLVTFRTLITMDHGDIGEECAQYVLYMESWLGLAQAAEDYAAFDADDYPRIGELADSLSSVLAWGDMQDANHQENPFSPLAGILGKQDEAEAIARLTQGKSAAAMESNDREAFDQAWQAMRQALSGFTYLAASGFSYAAQMALRLSPLLLVFDNGDLLAEGEGLMPEYTAANPQQEEIENSAPKYGGGK